MIEVPVINLGTKRHILAAQLRAACEQFGFFQIVGHGIPAADLSSILEAARHYFALPPSAKHEQLRSLENPWGYYDRELTKQRVDRKEIFDIGPDVPFGSDDPENVSQTPWPAEPAAFRTICERWFATMSLLAHELVTLIAEQLGDEKKVIRKAFLPSHSSFLRLNHYPVPSPSASLSKESEMGIHEHTDAGAITLLLQDGVPALQVMHRDSWLDIASVEGGLTVNLGDTMEVWSNGLFRAPLHRVLASGGVERFSVPFFYNPSLQAIVEPIFDPPRFRPIPWSDFRRRRANGDYGDYGTEVQISDWAV